MVYIYIYINNSYVCEIDNQLYTVLNKPSFQKLPFFLTHHQKTLVNHGQVRRMIQRAVETGLHITNSFEFGLVP